MTTAAAATYGGASDGESSKAEEEEDDLMEFEQVIEYHIGPFGFWQQLLLLGSALTYLPAILYLPTFPNYVPNFRCRVPSCEAADPTAASYSSLSFIVPGNGSVGDDVRQKCRSHPFLVGSGMGAEGGGMCGRQNFNFSAPPVSCADGYVYDDSVFAHSLTSDFDAAPCGDEAGLFTKVQLPETLFWLGMMAGNTVFGWTADLYGGRRTIIFVSAVISVMSLFIGFVNSLQNYTWCVVVIGFCALSASNVSQAVLSEAVPCKHRRVLVATKILRVIGSLASGVVAYVSQDWRVIWWYGSVLNALIVPMWLFLNESPRWLLSKGHYDRAERSLNFSAGLNGTKLPEMVMDRVMMTSRDRNAREEKKKAAGGSIRFFRDGVIWKNLLVIYFAWFSTLMVHFGLIRRSVRQDTGDIYTNFFLMDSTEMIAIVVSLFTINSLGRRTLLTLSCGIGGLLIVIGQVIGEYPNVILVLLFAAKTCASISNQVFTVFVAELFPTDIRNSALGTGNTFGRLGALCGSLLVNSPVLAHWDLAVLGLTFLASALAVLLLLPETNGVNMPETLLDVRRMEQSALYFWIRSKVCGSKCCGNVDGCNKEEKESLL